MPSVQTVAPSTTPISLDEAKRHLRVDASDDDTYIAGLVSVATLAVEEFARRALIRQTRRLDLYSFADSIVLDYPPLASVSNVGYVASGATDASTAATTLYNVDSTSDPGCVYLAADQAWPEVQDNLHNAVQVTYVTGFATSSSGVPENYRHAVKMLVDRWYNDRTDYKVGAQVNDLPWGVKDLIRPTRNFRFV